MPILKDRKLDFSGSKEDEWKIILDKVGDGTELPEPTSDRWFLAKVEGDGIRITGAEKNLRPLKIHEPPLLELEDFKQVAEIYNDFLFPDINLMSSKMRILESSPNLKYYFNLIYNFL